MPRLSKIGAAALAAFGWSTGSSVTATYLQVAGGGGGAGGNSAFQGGGGGAGGLLTGTTSLNPTLSYTVTVGAGGVAGVGGNGTQGSNSQFGTLTASVGGGYGANRATTGGTGGSGGGGGDQGGSGSAGSGGSATSGQGNTGGNGASGTNYGGAGGGGGAGAVGSNASTNSGGNGGAGSASSITGSSVTYAGGGGGGGNYNQSGTGGTGGSGGGGTANQSLTGSATSGTANTGGGGGGSSYTAGSGGSGVVIISYPSPQKFGGGIVTTSGSNTIHTFQTSGTLSPLSTLSASYLIVAGGGGGGAYNGGGGGAGGLLTGSGITIDTNSIYVVTIGAGGSGQIASTQSVAGSNSLFSPVSTTAIGGGKGGGYTGSFYSATSGGSGGGAAYAASSAGIGTSGQGNNGGTGVSGGPDSAGGGGGAGTAGSNGGSTGGNGGAGVSSTISGTSTYYAGGGGGASYPATGGTAGGTGGNGGGGNGGYNSAGTAGAANRGGGGGGSQDTNNPPNNAGGNGGSGIVIISYAGSTQQMAGGTVTISGGNVIHTFTSSGYLAPLKLVNNSLRFRHSNSSWLSRTPTVAGNQQKFTWSGWVKLGWFDLSYNPQFFGCATSTSNYFQFGWSSGNLGGSNAYSFGAQQSSGGNTYGISTTALYRDPAAWYHVVLAVDTTQATSTNRMIMYVNGVRQTPDSSSSGQPPQNTNFLINSTITHGIGYSNVYSNYLDGYLTEVNFIDGQQLTPSSFGTFNSYGVWQPITYGGSYGTNGFYLPFTNKTSTTTLGYDFSPAGNNWTPNNISLTAGATYDSMTDVPTLTSATVANYAVLNPIQPTGLAAQPTFSNANLTINQSAASTSNAVGTIAIPSGAFYWEAYASTITGGSHMNGIYATNTPLTNQVYGSIRSGNNGWNNLSGVNTPGTTYTANSWISVAVDVTNGKCWFAVNGTWVASGNPATGANPAFTFTPGTSVLPYFCFDNQTGNKQFDVNFGQQPFQYTSPTGFVALNTYNI